MLDYKFIVRHSYKSCIANILHSSLKKDKNGVAFLKCQRCHGHFVLKVKVIYEYCFHVELKCTLLWLWVTGDPNLMTEHYDLEDFIDAVNELSWLVFFKP